MNLLGSEVGESGLGAQDRVAVAVATASGPQWAAGSGGQGGAALAALDPPTVPFVDPLPVGAAKSGHLGRRGAVFKQSDSGFSCRDPGGKALTCPCYPGPQVGTIVMDGGLFMLTSSQEPPPRNEGFRFQNHPFQAAIAVEDRNNDSIRVFIPKLSLLGRATPADAPAPTDSPVRLGALTQIQVSVIDASNGSAIYWYDELPDQGQTAPPYHPTAAVDGAAVAIVSSAGGTAAFTYGSDQPYLPVGYRSTVEAVIDIESGSTIPLALRNLADSARQFEMHITRAGDAHGWDVASPPPIRVAAGDERIVHAVVTTPKHVSHGDTATFDLRAASTGHPDEAVTVSLQLAAAQGLGPDSARLYFHNSDGRTHWMNPLHLDPTSQDETYPIRTGGQSGSGPTRYDYQVDQDVALPHPLWLDSARPMTLDLDLEYANASVLDARIHVLALGGTAGCTDPSCVDWVQLGTTTKIIEQPAGRQLTNFSLAVDRAVAYVEEQGGTRIRILVELFDESVESRTVLRPPLVWPGKSGLDLPVVDTARAIRDRLVHIQPLADTQRFVNPGEHVQFPIRIANDGDADSSVEVRVTASPHSGPASLVPPGPFRIGPGIAVRSTLVVQAPVDALEGQVMEYEVNLAPLDGQPTNASILLQAVVTSGVDLPDEPDAPEADNETAAAIIDGTGAQSSTSGALATIMALAICCIVGRRRAGATH